MLAERGDVCVLRVGDVVAKAHEPQASPEDLRPRMAVAAHPAYRGILLPPEGGRGPVPLAVGGRLASLWGYGAPVDPENPAAAPWEAAGALLARLHAAPAPAALPPMRGPGKAARALARMRAATPASAAHTHRAAAEAVERAWRTLPGWCRGESPPPRATAVCHGDFHLGQLVRHPAPHGPWLLIDVDDLGLGDPAWDLARPACWYATGLLAPAEWERFLGAYEATRHALAHRGNGIRSVREHAPAPRPGRDSAAGPDTWPGGDGDLWAYLDAPARALTVQTAALAVAKARTGARALDEAEQACIGACFRIASLGTPATARAATGPAAAPELPPRQGPYSGAAAQRPGAGEAGGPVERGSRQ
ncbi:aminoglycoside phosphotransferase family protein [Streptomyces axinellae]|uniref:Aminoglycoside phosphotransferase family protein n=1 Tax=Streptomyces axinellae TaxID=552788 RepID=A0ABN3PQ31_9ACTN